MNNEKRKFGKNDIEVSVLGYGAGHIGSPEMDDNFVGSLLNQIIDNGITLIDTAKGYDLSEERIGKHLSYRRHDFVLSTKVGYGVDGVEDWTYDCIVKGVDIALKTLQTDYIDIVHLHSCSKEVLERGDVIEALLKTVEAGKVRAAAYSGENEDLDFVVNCGNFNSIQTSINMFDQRGLKSFVKNASQNGMGVIAKRPLANAPWRFKDRPVGHYCEEYWSRMKKMQIDTHGLSWNELALRYTAFANGVSSCIVGSTNIDHIKENIKIVEKGNLEQEIISHIESSFEKNDENWIGQI